MNKLSALGIARIIRAVADPLNHARLDAEVTELVASLEAGLTCYAILDLVQIRDQLVQIRFSPRGHAPRRLQALVAYRFVELPAAFALEVSLECVRIARAAAMAQVVINIDAAGGTVPADVDFAHLLEISPEGAAAWLHNLAAAHAAGDSLVVPRARAAPGLAARSARALWSERAEVDDPSLVPLATKLSDTYCHVVGMTGTAWKDLGEAERRADLTAIAAVRRMIWSERADVLIKVGEMSTMAHEIAMSADARRLADRTASSEIRSKLLAKELTSDQVAGKASQIFELAVAVLAGAGAEGASITSCRMPDDEEPSIGPATGSGQ